MLWRQQTANILVCRTERLVVVLVLLTRSQHQAILFGEEQGVELRFLRRAAFLFLVETVEMVVRPQPQTVQSLVVEVVVRGAQALLLLVMVAQGEQ
jgi:hypothetical protein